MLNFHDVLSPEPGKVTLTNFAIAEIDNASDHRLASLKMGRMAGNCVINNFGVATADASNEDSVVLIGQELGDQLTTHQILGKRVRSDDFQYGYLEAAGVISPEEVDRVMRREGVIA